VQFIDERYSVGSAGTNRKSLVVPGLKGSVFWADDRISTKRGIRLSATVIGSEENVLASTSFLQTTLRAKAIYSFFDEWRLLGRGVQFIDERYSVGSAGTNRKSLVVPGLKGSVFWADDRISTKRGIRLSATVIGSEENVLAGTSFLQTTLRAKAIYSFFDEWRLLGRGEIGTTLVNDIYNLPPTLRYYAGGDQSVRGYGYKRIGPVDAQGNVVGGKDLLTCSVELERTLFDAWSGAVFYDSGTATNSFADLAMHSGAGIGVRWNGVFGQIRLDVAKALDQEGTWRIHLTMGADL